MSKTDIETPALTYLSIFSDASKTTAMSEKRIRMKKGYHKTKSGKVAKKGLYFYANKRKKAGKKPIKKGKSGYVTKSAIKRSATTARS